jgi:predicted amidohydrolase YtcJ
MSATSHAADGAILGADICTLDPRRPRATAAAWRDGALLAVGDDDEVRELTGPATDVIDGHGLWVCPGLVDSHIHPFWGTVRTRGVDLRSALTLDEVRRRLAGERARLGDGEWLLAHSVRYEPFHESGIRADIVAEATGGAPTVISFFDGHTSLASQEALALAGVTGPRKFDEASEVVCDAAGRPTGALLERAAMELVNAVVPAWSEAELLDAYTLTLRRMNAVGLTGAHVMIGGPELLDRVGALEERGDLTVRMLMPMHLEPQTDEAEVQRRLATAGRHGRLWRTGTAKFFLDGVLDSGTAWLVDPGPGGVNAHPFWPDVDHYRELVARFTGAGFSAITHAVADGAVRGALDAYQAAGPPQRGMHRIEHIETLTDPDLPRFAALGVAASMQPLHMEGLDDPSTPSNWVDNLSEGRYERGFRSGDLLRSGAVVALGSDWMVAEFDPRLGMAWARLRRQPGDRDRVPYLAAQALDAEATLAGYTTAPAQVAGSEHEYGRLTAGLRADLSVFEADLVATEADELLGVPVAATIVDGACVYRAGSATAA